MSEIRGPWITFHFIPATSLRLGANAKRREQGAKRKSNDTAERFLLIATCCLLPDAYRLTFYPLQGTRIIQIRLGFTRG
jgi:hypothetical protein